MTELRGDPRRSGVTGFAGVITDDVIGRLARCLHAVVTIKAIASNRTMIKTRCHPRGSRMTQRTIEGGIDVIRWFADGLHAVVTTGTGS